MHSSMAGQSKPNYTIIVWMVAIHILLLLAPFTFSWGGIVVLLVLYFLTACLGITLGFHRLLTHRSLKAPRWLERFLATLGTLALQGGPFRWVAQHRMHHCGADSDEDPHDSRRGFWHSHIGWMLQRRFKFDDVLRLQKFARDICADPYLLWLSRPAVQIVMQVVLGLVLLVIGGWGYVIWGVFVRLVVVYHVTWLVNSASHMWGYRRYETKDGSMNNWYVALLTFGEGWHNNHHAEPSAVHVSRSWWELDLTWLVIKIFSFVGLVRELKLPEKLTGQEQGVLS